MNLKQINGMRNRFDIYDEAVRASTGTNSSQKLKLIIIEILLDIRQELQLNKIKRDER